MKPRVASAGRAARWDRGFQAETWYWGFAISIAAFAVTLKLPLFFMTLGLSLAAFWVSSSALSRSSKVDAAGPAK